MKVTSFPIIGTNIAAVTYNQVIKLVKLSLERNSRFLISPATSHTLVKAFFNKEVRASLNAFNLVVPDGQWVRWALNFIHKVKLPDRVYGPELMLKMVELAELEKLRVFFYGANKKTLLALGLILKRRYPKLKISGSLAPRFGQSQAYMLAKLMLALSKAKTDIIFLSLGSPKQDVFVSALYHSGEKNLPLIAIPVGAAFDFISEAKPQAPAWMQKIGMESAFRLIKEPSRLWKRYLIYSPSFVLLVLFQKLLNLADIGNRKVLIFEVRR